MIDKEQGSGPDEAGQPKDRKLCYLKMKVRYTIRLKITQGAEIMCDVNCNHYDCVTVNFSFQIILNNVPLYVMLNDPCLIYLKALLHQFIQFKVHNCGTMMDKAKNVATC